MPLTGYALNALKTVVQDELQINEVNDDTLIYADGDAPIVGPIDDKMVYLFNIIYDVEELFSIVIPDNAVSEMKTFADLVKVVDEEVGKRTHH